MSLTSFKPTLKQKDVPVPSMGKGATIIMTEKTAADVVRLQALIRLLEENKIEGPECFVAAVLICTMKKPDGSYLLPNNDTDTINLVAHQTSVEVTDALYEAYVELNPSIETPEVDGEKTSMVDAKKKKS